MDLWFVLHLFYFMILTLKYVFLGTDRMIQDLEAMLGPKPAWLWQICTVSWKFVSPLVLIVILSF